MQLLTLISLSLPLFGIASADELKIEKTLTHECKRRTQNGDTVDMHYRGTLASNGNEFDASYKRGQPLSFQLGAGRVIKGWDQGLLEMCPGDKRTLTIPPELGYGSRGMGPIPANSVLVFETELVGIKGVDAEPKVLAESADKSSEKITDKIVDSVKDAAKQVTGDPVESKAEAAEPEVGQNPQDEKVKKDEL